MTLSELVSGAYLWVAAHGGGLMIGSIAIPALGTLAARVGKGGKTDEDGRFIASAVVGIGLAAMLLEILTVFLASRVLGKGFFDIDVLVLAAPLVCFVLCLVGIRWVFPLNELASVRTAVDVGIFLAACGGIVWLFSMFRGWGIVFMGGIRDLIVFGILGYFLLGRLYRRAVGDSSKPAATPR